MAQGSNDDADVQELLQHTRQLVGIAYRLSQDIDRAVDDLTEFSSNPGMMYRDRRDKGSAPYTGTERRRRVD